jgi:hypothetical protein
MNPGRIFILFLLLEVAIIALGFYAEEAAVTGWQTITRFSGRLSLFLFSIIFLLQHKPESLHYWLSNRFYLLFAMVHGIHLVELITYVRMSGTSLIPIRVGGGALAYSLIFLMPVFWHYRMKGRISVEKFFVVQTVFMYYTWLVFFLTYLPRVQGKLPQAGGNYIEHVALLGWVSTMLGMKLAGLIQFRRS